MSDWKLAPDGKTLIYTGAGGAPLLSGAQQVAMRSQLSSGGGAAAPAPTASKGLVPNPTPGTVIQQGAPKVPGQVPATGNPGLAYNLAHPQLAPAGLKVQANGAILANDTSFAGPGDTIVQMADGSKTVLMKNGTVITVAGGGGAEGGGGGGGGHKSGGSSSAPAMSNAPTKVLGPQKAKDLLPAFSPPALNQFKQFYDPNEYLPVAGSSNLPAGFQGKTLPDIGNQSGIAQTLGVPWSAEALNLEKGHAGYGLPPVDMTKGGGLQSNYVDPSLYGYVSPTLNPAWYQGARSTAK